MHRIYVIEDDGYIYEMLESMLAQYNPRMFNCPAAALKELRSSNNPPGLIVTDYLMPKMNGLDFLKEVSAIYPKVPKLLISGTPPHHTPKDVTVLSKPFRAMQLIDMVDQHISLHIKATEIS